ncbi:MAG: hypothetical protein ACRD82_02775, partial [Blastocatellia bacterium]
YYSTEGKSDAVLIDLPKGHYTPIFSYATGKEDQAVNGKMAANLAVADQSIASPVITAPAITTAATAAIEQQTNSSPYRGALHTATQRAWQMVAMAFAVLAVVLGAMTLFYHAKTNELAQANSGALTSENDQINRHDLEPLWGDLLRSAEPVLVVYSNTLFLGTAEDGMKLLKSLDSPGSSLGSPIIPQSEIEQSKQPVIEHYTGIGEVMGAYQLGELFAKLRHASRVKRSLLLNWEDLKTENIVVLGSPAENFFLRDLPQQQDFLFKPMPDEKGHKSFGIINTRPQPGQQNRYFATQGGPSRSQISEDYAVVSLLQGLNGKKRILILAGITTLGTQAAAEYVTKPDNIRDLIQHLNIAPAGAQPKLPDNYQILVKVKVNGGVPVQISYVTHHVLDH